MDLRADISKAADILSRGGLVVFPTETVYGLGADATQTAAIEKIFEVKQRPTSHALIVHLADAHAMHTWAVNVPESARILANAFWPGPLTLVLQRAPHVCSALTGGLQTIALRVPRHDVARQLLRELGKPIAAPSANRFTHVSPTRAEHVEKTLGAQVDMILNAGPCEVGLESTIVDLSQETPRILRPGSISQHMLESVLARPVIAHVPPHESEHTGTLPGRHPIHYAPKAQVILVQGQEAITTAERLVQDGKRVMVWAPFSAPSELSHIDWALMPSDLDRLGHELYATLHQIDAQAYDVLVVALFAELQNDTTIGVAIRDRLHRASQSR